MRESPVNRLEGRWPQPVVPSSAPNQASWSQRAKSWEENLENFMGDHPKFTLLTGATIGLLLGWLVKRK
jgi:ElaB/YqjD/DUF883 family membrane-anchored ribosome-binding protein